MNRAFSRLTSRSFSQYNLNPGQKIHGFVLEKIQPIPLYKITGYKLVHENTKANFIHIDSLSSKNTFSIVFPTPPSNNSGVSYILQKLILCGSKKYPVRNFIENMKTRTLSSYMDASTGSDHTMYAFGSNNKKDMLNLASLYLENIFFPLLLNEDFMQEGHRIELHDSHGIIRNGDC